jgi:serine/threonine protein kinase
MRLSGGDKLGPYEILASIGAGGMGEVYRAHDTRLNRDVAIKVSQERFSDRFERETRAVAALNHPNICHLYDVGPNYLVMELIEGAPPKGPLPLDQALNLARQIAEALEAAHERGIIHRDLKPANIKVTPEGTAKLLDFGLAKAAEPPAGSAENSPTLTISPTRAGMILGTAAYMAPEQARGKTVDARADIWSFGAVLYEMLSGEQAFVGESVSDVLASVLKLDPDWDRLPKNTPAAIRKLLRRCLTKDRRQRLQAIGEARIAIEETIQGKPDETTPVVMAKRPVIAWALAGLMTTVAGAALWGWLHRAPPEPRNVVRLTADLPSVSTSNPGTVALSRDGSRLAFVAEPQEQIYVQMMDQFEAKPIPGTNNAAFLCFSPDGQWISFVSRSPTYKLTKIAVAGGPSQVLAEVLASVGPPIQDWGLDDNILYSNNGVLMRIPAAGGKPQTLATPDPKQNEQDYTSAQLLPGGTQVLVGIGPVGGSFTAQGGKIAALNLKTGEKKILVESVSAAPRYLPTGSGSSGGYMVHYASSTASLMAVPFDASRLEPKGSPAPVLDGVLGFSTSPLRFMDVADIGTLAYIAGRPGADSNNTLVWVDRKGIEQPLAAPPRYYLYLRLSPDGQRIAVGVTAGGRQDVWVYDVARSTLHKIITEQDARLPVWTPDGKRLIYDEGPRLMSAPADGSGAPRYWQPRKWAQCRLPQCLPMAKRSSVIMGPGHHSFGFFHLPKARRGLPSRDLSWIRVSGSRPRRSLRTVAGSHIDPTKPALGRSTWCPIPGREVNFWSRLKAATIRGGPATGGNCFTEAARR